ncbi:hypothetical protein H6P81_016075 [Aristolochia fimbriata]|uniref:Alpha-1,3-glucosyltransferase n=1 Tax=Aristolochia fimbriata TaxID=158543 RepID=A0AAV7E792_ARIFI|nr:hypothetical protein H6P81_016075 [Aristolochia fimbriata]
MFHFTKICGEVQEILIPVTSLCASPSKRKTSDEMHRFVVRCTRVLSSSHLFYFSLLCSSWQEGCFTLASCYDLMLNHALIVIDHGHFQYNCICLGFTVGAVAAVLAKHDLLASVLFSLVLNHEQKSAYFAPAFFAHLLGKCLKRQYPLLEVLKLGIAVVVTFAVMWWPYLYSVDAVMEFVIIAGYANVKQWMLELSARCSAPSKPKMKVIPVSQRYDFRQTNPNLLLVTKIPQSDVRNIDVVNLTDLTNFIFSAVEQ